MTLLEEEYQEPENIITCFACKQKFKYTEEDIKTDGIGRKYVDCPKCSMDIKL